MKTGVFHVVGDSAYGGQSVLAHLPENCDLTSRLDLDARLYDPPPVRKPEPTGGHASAANVCPRRDRCSRGEHPA